MTARELEAQRLQKEWKSTIDVAPTIAGLVGISPFPAMDGLDLSDIIAGRGPSFDRLGVPISWGGGEDVPA